MSTRPRIPPAVPNQDANFATVTAHNPNMIGQFFELYAHFWQQGLVAADVKELTRIRNARLTDCGY